MEVKRCTPGLHREVGRDNLVLGDRDGRIPGAYWPADPINELWIQRETLCTLGCTLIKEDLSHSPTPAPNPHIHR